jgi:alkylation response protein AidB-like acyl-CoA dehydrogenase
VVVSDDWDGFGQRLTGSGAAVFTDARVEAQNVFPFSERFPYQTALYQLVLLATLAGIARAVEQDAGAEVRGRTRVYSHGNAAQTKDDPQIQQAVGEISARAYGSAATTLAVGASLQRAWEAHVARVAGPGADTAAGTRTPADSILADAELRANVAAEIESAQAQVVVIDLVLKAASDLFNVLGASGVSTTRALDRHWRNARTVASHNPLLFKARIVGDWVINDTPPPFLWSIGTPPPEADHATAKGTAEG